jgi:hypothetical protein
VGTDMAVIHREIQDVGANVAVIHRETRVIVRCSGRRRSHKYTMLIYYSSFKFILFY